MTLKSNIFFMKTLLFTSLVLISGCGYNKWSQPIVSFSATAPATFDSISTLYTTSNSIHIMQEQAVLVDQYSVSNFKPNQITNFISDKDLLIRTNSLASLKTYAAALESIVNPTVAIPALPSSIVEPTISTAQKNTGQELGIAAGQLNNITTQFLHKRARHDLPKIIKTADPLVQQFVVLFVLDLTDLKQQEKNDYESVLIYQSQFIQNNQDKMSAVEKRTEIEKLAQIEKDALTAQANLDSAINNIQKLAVIHHQLAGEK